MIDSIRTENIPIFCWLDIQDIESGALDQLKNITNLPFAFHHTVALPGLHQGYGMPIESVLATNSDVVVPFAIGSDIGCGMCYINTDIPAELLIDNMDLRKKVIGDIRKVIPVGFNKHKKPQDKELMPNQYIGIGSIVSTEYDNALLQLGTLGGGNHFAELQSNETGNLNVMIHSGSRHMGNTICNFYHKRAKEINEVRYYNIPDHLNFLHKKDEEYDDYIYDMNYCIEYAIANRSLMMTRIIEVIKNNIGSFEIIDSVDTAHNYASLENHFGKNVLVHRKGAISAKEGEIGIIPGSQGTSSYIVKGLGNKLSFTSCSHGAGRRMSRKKAKKVLDLEQVQKNLNDVGILHSVRTVKDLDEAPEAYKDIDKVIILQDDLVKPISKLTPFAVVKG